MITKIGENSGKPSDDAQLKQIKTDLNSLNQKIDNVVSNDIAALNQKMDFILSRLE